MGATKPTRASNGALFEKIINDGRDRRRSQNLANSILSSKSRRNTQQASAPPAGSFASRVGVKKVRQAPVPTAPKNAPTGPRSFSPKVPSLASRVSSPAAKGLATMGPPKPKTQPKPKPGSLAARIGAGAATAAGPKGAKINKASGPHSSFFTISTRASPPPGQKQRHRHKQDYAHTQAMHGKPEPMDTEAQSSFKSKDMGLSIKGIAGPFAVLAQNFAPGTTAADIESAMTPVGGEMLSCDIMLTTPFILAEMVFATREGGERVVARFNNQTADGRIIKVFPKPGGYVPPVDDAKAESPHRAVPVIIDGTQGFAPDDYLTTNGVQAPASTAPTGGLYSDELVAGVRKGRGFKGGWSYY